MRKALALAVLMAFGAISPAAASEPAQAGSPVTVSNAKSFDLVSSVNGARIRLLVWQPPGPVPEGGFPVLYAFDGDDSFGLLSDVALKQASALRRAGLRPAVVVALGYAEGEGTADRRIFDLTPKAGSYDMPVRPNGQPWPKLGGGDDFLETVERDVKPLVIANYPVDMAQETLFGHSLGGLMTLHAWAVRPAMFDRYFASSPSIWVNGRKVLDEVKDALAGGSAGKPHLMVTVGGGEEDLTALDRIAPGDLAVREAWVKGNRMVGNAHDLAAIFTAAGVENFTFQVLDGFDHISVQSVSAWRALEMATAR